MPKTYNELYIGLWQRLREAGIEAAALEARLLTAAAAGKTMAELLRDLRLYASDAIEAKAETLAGRRLAGEPAAYLTGSWSFYGLELSVNRDVLIPRSDTEVLVDKALELVRDRREQRILDLCTGSGCIGCALAVHCPDSRLLLLDLSEKALAVAQQNVQRLGLSERAECVRGDVLAPPPPGLGSFDLIVTNPPYVPRGELPVLDPSVRDYEPLSALDGGDDGLDFYRAVFEHWAPLLRPTGWLLAEVGEDQAGSVKGLLRRAGLHSIEGVKDTQGIDRVVLGKK